ncbi:MAG TPA: DUF4293 domain-containing protein [Saprospiraceae bacterium]|nr:DUF4293 domain-containing protein [Saprospiraceae bacterium]HNG89551.1 DUF4293 domain-containing protein [Saprospiraceae bacterium]
MIQRIQTVYLFLAAAAALGQFALPYLVAATTGPLAMAVPALSDGRLNPLDNTGLLALTALTALVSAIAIFLFRNRPLQGRLAGSAIIASLLLLLLAGLTTKQTLDSVPTGESVQYQAGLALPLLAMLFQWLAMRNIGKDEKLVRSMDRLR